MDEELIEKAKAYVAGRDLTIGVPLGFGIHGIVLLVVGQREPGSRALKMHHSEEFYLREHAVYERLKTAGVSSICGCEVPRLIRFDNELLALEMTVVSPPFVLDFAGAYLNFPPDFSEAIWTTWEAEKREQFGARWPEVTLFSAHCEASGFTCSTFRPAISAYNSSGSRRSRLSSPASVGSGEEPIRNAPQTPEMSV